MFLSMADRNLHTLLNFLPCQFLRPACVGLDQQITVCPSCDMPIACGKQMDCNGKDTMNYPHPVFVTESTPLQPSQTSYAGKAEGEIRILSHI